MSDTHRRMLDPFDTMRANRVLSPNDPKLNDIRWLVGESLRRTHRRSSHMLTKASLVAAERNQAASGDLARLQAAEDRVGPHAWPIIVRIVIEGAGVGDCRGFVPELATPWRADAVITDRLRVALDMIGTIMGVTARRAQS